jgi:acyl-CoA thioester hydrolase
MEALREYPVVIDIPVAWGEMDAFQHVNNVAYFRYFESGRIAYFERLKLLTTTEATGIGPILASTQARFRVPLTYPDTVSVGVRVASVGADRFVMQYALYSRKLETIAATGEGLIVMYDYRVGQKAAVSAELRAAILSLEPTPLQPA